MDYSRFSGSGGDSTTRARPIWHLAATNNRKPKVVTERTVTEQELREKPYKGAFFF